ncbi:hypothetical protein BGW37DRAFT_168742 [Umbelopsis sp. PMI_123]|nr:hypothetical protein BGW37DRAFT_168742 [Umbelopsis sp. PMI_123]
MGMQYNSLVWKIPTVFRLASLLTSIIVIVIFYLMCKYRPSLADRISLRLIFASNISGVILIVWQTAAVFLSSQQRIACLSADFFLIMNDTITSLFLMIIGVNLMLIAVFRIPPSKTMEYGYYVFSCSVGLANGLVVVLHTEAYDLPDNFASNCWFVIYYTNNSYLRFSSIYRYIFSIVIIVLSTIIFTSTLIVLYSKKEWIQQSCDLTRRRYSSKYFQNPKKNFYCGNKKNQVTMFRKVAMRCMLYPAVLIFVNIWGFIYFILEYTKDDSNIVLLIMDQCMQGCTGTEELMNE